MNKIPLGICQCGCGQKTNIIKNTVKAKGRIAGQHNRFLDGHQNSRENSDERFWSNVPKEPSGKCWNWLGTINGQGYGVIMYHGKVQRASRIMYEKHNAPIPTNRIFVCHRCDNRACVNPAHLFLGTPADNMKDMSMKGRSLLGERNHKAKLKATDIPKIRSLYASGKYSQREIGEMFGVKQYSISHIVIGKHWRHVL